MSGEAHCPASDCSREGTLSERSVDVNIVERRRFCAIGEVHYAQATFMRQVAIRVSVSDVTDMHKDGEFYW